jgi:asparagine synthase (glutamine-hydrolysing)
MCRIAGLIDHQSSAEKARHYTLAMRDSLAYGGPDDAGLYQEGPLCLAHRRLSIIDLSAAGHQPMIWGDWVLVFNGEIYNYQEIRVDLQKQGYLFTSQSDSEVLVKAFDCWHTEAVTRFRGMFAFALWNKKSQKLLLCRDRVGAKPLFWYQHEGLLLFASELKAFHEHPGFVAQIDQAAVSLYLQTGYIKAPFCIFQHTYKVEPGGFVEIDLKGQVRQWKYWDVRQVYENQHLHKASDSDLIEQCEKLLEECFQLRMVADVPVGMFLSGGIDSSLLTAILQKNSPHALHTFSIGFENTQYDEAPYARAIAQHLGTEHTELYCTETDFKSILPLLPEMHDEPFGDSSAIPTFLVSRLARAKVKVSLSADGGDELFAGYTKYQANEAYYRRLRPFPLALRKMAAQALGQIPPDWVEKALEWVPGAPKLKGLQWRMPKLLGALGAQTPVDFQNLASLYIVPAALQKLHHAPIEAIAKSDFQAQKDAWYGLFGVIDLETYLPGDIMTKVDRATMQVALEGREPFLDHKLMEFALALPDHLKIREGKTKWILRQILYQYVPQNLIERPKMGFAIPVQEWLKNHLREDLENLVQDSQFAETFALDQAELQKIIRGFLAPQTRQSPHFVWFLYVLWAWYERWIS